ncbi:hypothetical protein Ferp_0424 [Ferroglobus placidus DSM 10642]|uniref:AbiEi antitoxin C-terminal domain-containing protein n=1 Tax=Ferroglobus placidus (strain DSM 10642 / AEDII12DO) TaxID=589924 RepID=D3S2W7_FERPA|nr:hypothetical protein [Ferroglobus placidus]ADC64600.1 hypothetical protein Ferp_0424 [Ferroglobus placidus DSM 10642]
MKKFTKYVLAEFGGKVITREEFEKACRRFGENTERAVNFMISYGYLVRILRGLYYVKTPEEFSMGKSVDTLKIISLGMNRLGVEWYFGLNTALRLNGVTHEFSPVIHVISDSIYRPKTIEINREDVKFIKLKKNLFGFGVVEKNSMKYSDLEKTLLDMVYLSRYRSTPEERIVATLIEYGKKARKKKLAEYLKRYPKSVERVVKNAGLV